MLLGAPNGRLGFRRIALVRAWIEGTATRYEVDGVVHRHPTTRPVSAAMAARLVADGVPFVVRRRATVEAHPC